MDQQFINILKTVIKEQGKDAVLDALKCKALLADYTKGEYKKESRLLFQALDAKVNKAVNASAEIDICRKQQVRLLVEDYFMAEEHALDLVDTLIHVIKGVPFAKNKDATAREKETEKKEAEETVKELYYISANGVNAGPYDIDIIKNKIASGEISRDTDVWKEGMDNWTAAKAVKELAGFLPPPKINIPSPPPPAKTKTPAPLESSGPVYPKPGTRGERIAVKDGWVYYSNPGDLNRLYKIKTDGAGRQKLSDDTNCYDISADDYYVFYSPRSGSSNLGLHRINLNGYGKERLIHDYGGIDGYIAADDFIYYQRNGLFRMRTDGSDKQKQRRNKGFIDFSIAGNWIYCKDRTDDHKIYRIKTDGTGIQKLNDDKCFNITVTSSRIYYTNYNDGKKLYRINIDGTCREKINDDECDYAIVTDDWIYYRNDSDSYKLYKIRADGSGRRKISDDRPKHISAAGDYIYCVIYGYPDKPDMETGGKLFKIRADGSECTLLD